MKLTRPRPAFNPFGHQNAAGARSRIRARAQLRSSATAYLSEGSIV